MKQSPHFVQSLVNLRGNRDFDAFLVGLKEYQDELTTRCIDGAGEVQLRAAGGVQALKAIEKMFDEAPTTLAKMKSTPQQVK